MADLFRLAQIAAREFVDIVVATTIIRGKLRVILSDGSYIDFWWSTRIPERFAHHWERIHIDGTIYRHDNMPHPRWRNVSTFPQHYHEGHPGHVVESLLSPDPPIDALRGFLSFARQKLAAAESIERDDEAQ